MSQKATLQCIQVRSHRHLSSRRGMGGPVRWGTAL